MLEKLLVQGILDQTFKKKIEIHPGACLRSRHDKDKCQRCFDLCPAGAIKLKEDQVYVDPLECTGCNLCVSSCYSRALHVADRPYLAFINKALDEKIKEFSCGCIESQGKADVNFGCLRTIDPRFLGAIFAGDLRANVKMDFSSCENCAYKDLGLDTKALIEDFKDKAESKFLKISFGTLEVREETDLSRRDLFKNIFKTTEDLAKSSVRQTSKDLGLDLETQEDVDTLIKILLKKALKDGKDLSMYLPYIYSLEGSPACVFCRLCENLCPTGAIKVEANKDRDQLVFDQSLCNFCGRCLEKCPSSALTKSSLKDFENKVLYKKEKSHCKSCKVATSDLDDEGLCPTCALRRKNRRRKINRR